MRIKLTNVFVDDQESALKFYTDILGFQKKHDLPLGHFKWLTVVSPEEPDGTELVLEPSANPTAKTYQQSLHEQGIAAAAFAVSNVEKEFERLKQRGVKFNIGPTDVGTTKIALFDDTCGNLIQIYQAP